MNLQQAQQTIADMQSGKIRWDDNVRAQANNVIDAADPVKQAQKIAQNAQDMQVQANQPAIQTLTTQKQSMADQYRTLLDSVLQSGTVASNQATTAENTLLGQRGITNDSPLYGQQMSSALLPVESQNKSLAANVGMGSAQDINQLAGQIAQLQAGNVPNALSYAGNLAGLQTQLQAQQMAVNAPRTVGQGDVLYNPATGKTMVNNNPFANSPASTLNLGGNATGSSGGNTSPMVSAVKTFSSPTPSAAPRASIPSSIMSLPLNFSSANQSAQPKPNQSNPYINSLGQGVSNALSNTIKFLAGI